MRRIENYKENYTLRDIRNIVIMNESYYFFSAIVTIRDKKDGFEIR